MKLSVTLNVVLLLLSSALLWLYMAQKEKNSHTSTADPIENIYTRTSIRRYTSSAVEDEKIEKILCAGMSAPTAMNRQPWAMIVVNRPSQMDSLHCNAPLAIVVCGDMNRAIEGDGRDFWVQDASAASQNILLAAHSLGLGAVWRGVYPIEKRIDEVKKVLELPDNIIPLNIITIGYPDESPTPKDKWKEENIHYNRW